jgi:hypothetical protein
MQLSSAFNTTGFLPLSRNTLTCPSGMTPELLDVLVRSVYRLLWQGMDRELPFLSRLIGVDCIQLFAADRSSSDN